MRNPMPVTTRIISADSGSRRSATGTAKSPEANHVAPLYAIACTPAGCTTSRRTAITDTPNEPSMASDASPPASGRASRRPARRGMRRSTPLSFQFHERVGVQAFHVPEQRYDNGKPDRSLGGRNGHHKKDDDLTVGRAEEMAERDERKIYRIEHHFDRQQHDDQVAPQKHTRRAYAEDHTGQH